MAAHERSAVPASLASLARSVAPRRGLPAAAGAVAAACAFGIATEMHADQAGLVFVAGVVVAIALGTRAGVAATLAGCPLYAVAGGTLLDVLLFLVLAATVVAVADRLRREQGRLDASEHRFRSLVEELPVGLYLDLPDTSATNVYSNPEIVRMLGYPADRWKDVGFFPSILHPDDRERVLTAIDDSLRAGGRTEDLYRLRDASGSYRWIADRSTLVHDERGRPLHVQGVLLDVTDAVDAERQAADAQRRYRSLIDELPLVTYVEDATDCGRTHFVSPQIAEFLGYPAERWLEDKDFFFTVLDPAFHDAVRLDRVDGVIDGSNEYRLLAADGSSRWIDSRRVTIRDDDGNPLYVQGFWVDVTERHELEEQLRRQERLDAIGQLTAGVAHNFNNMLCGIRGYAELAATRPTVELASRDLAAIRGSADRAAALVQQLLAFSRRQAMTPTPTDLATVVAELLGLLRQLLGGGIDVRYREPRGPVVACVDRSQIEQVIVNLAVNARDAMPEGGILTIDLHCEGDGSVVLAVSDTGCGMPAAVADRAFDPFFTTKEFGSGLGLATVHGTVQQSGGSIRIARTAPGEGTSFEIVLFADAPASLAA
jgi:PAS domain S-box-containing protein